MSITVNSTLAATIDNYVEKTRRHNSALYYEFGIIAQEIRMRTEMDWELG